MEENDKQTMAQKIINKTKDHTSEFDKEDIEKNKKIAALSYLVFFLPYLEIEQSPYAKFHSDQSFKMLANVVVFAIICTLITVFFGRWYFKVIIHLFWILPTIWLILVGTNNAMRGKAKLLPFIRQIEIQNLIKKNK